MKRDSFDRFLQNVTYGVALVRVLRGEDPEAVAADVERMNAKAVALRDSIKAQVAEPSSAPSSKGHSA